jgi:hypothetical protein
MIYPQDHTAALREAFETWWRDITRKGDPLRRPNLTAEAYAAGWKDSRIAALAQPQPPAGSAVSAEMVKAAMDAYDTKSWTRVDRMRGAIEAALNAAPAHPAEQQEGKPVPVLAAAMALLVAGGFVTQEKVSEAIQIALNTPGMAEQQEGGDALRERVRDAIAEALGSAYDCLRVWEAWSVGTMSRDDFSLIADDEERLYELTDAAIAAMTGGSNG